METLKHRGVNLGKALRAGEDQAPRLGVTDPWWLLRLWIGTAHATRSSVLLEHSYWSNLLERAHFLNQGGQIALMKTQDSLLHWIPGKCTYGYLPVYSVHTWSIAILKDIALRLKWKFNWVFSILSVNPTPNPLLSPCFLKSSSPHLCAFIIGQVRV